MPNGRSLPAPSSGSEPSHRLRCVGPFPIPRQFPKPTPHAVRLDVREGLSVHPGGPAVAADPPPGLREKVLAPHLVDQRVKTPVGCFLSDVTRSGVPGPFLTLLGSHQWSRLFPLPYRSRTRAPSLRPALPAIPVLQALRHPAGPACPSRGSGWNVRSTDRASRVAPAPLFHACRRHCPCGRRNRPVRMSLTSRPVAAFPEKQAGRLPHYAFRGLGVHSRCGPYGR